MLDLPAARPDTTAAGPGTSPAEQPVDVMAILTGQQDQIDDLIAAVDHLHRAVEELTRLLRSR